MAIIKLYSDNPKDGTTIFDKVRFYEADDSTGTNAAVIATVDINTANVTFIDSGFTFYTYPSGSITKYYASTWYNSSSTIETTKSDYVQGGEDRWDTMFKSEMQDTAEAVWTDTDRGYMKTKALEALYPDFFYETIDTSLTVDNDTAPSFQYTIPFGIFNISEVGIGKPNDYVNQPFKVVHPNNWVVEQNKLRFNSLSGMTDDYDIRLVCSKKYLDVGEVPSRLDPLAMYHLRMSAYIKMADDYPRFLTWARLQKGTKVSFENLRLHAREFERLFNAEREKQKDLMGSVRI
jgi:hypothetical protein